MTVTVRQPQLLPQEEIERYAGRWVAIKDGAVIKDADDPETVVNWLRDQGIEPDIVRQLPTEAEAEVWIL